MEKQTPDRSRKRAVLLAAFLASAGSAGAEESWRDLSRAARAARESQDWTKYRDLSRQVAELLHGHPEAVLAIARAEMRLGNRQAALESLSRFAGMGLMRDLAAEPDLEGLRGTPEFDAILARVAQHQQPVSRSTVAFKLADPQLLAEDIAYDAAGQRFLLTSVHKRKVVAVTRDGVANDLVPSGADGLWAAMALAVDAERKNLWVSTAAVEFAADVPKEERGRTALLRYELPSGRLLQRYPLEAGKSAVLGDLVVGPAGEVYLSDSEGGGLYVLRPGAEKLEAFVAPGPLPSPQGLVVAPDGGRLIVADYVRGLATVDLKSAELGWIAVPAEVAILGIDGLYRHGAGLIGVQNGTKPARILRMHLDPGFTRIERAEVLEANTPGLGDPTHGTIVDGEFWFIANSGWDRAAEDGTLAPGEPAAVWRLPLP